MKPSLRLSRLWTPKVRWTVLGLLWCAALFGGAIPMWKRAKAQNQEIHQLEAHLANLDQWTVAGMWLSRSVASRQMPVNTAFGRLFPGDRLREDLFLDLARVADLSGVEGFDLAEMTDFWMADNDIWGSGPNMSNTDNDAAPPPEDDSEDGLGLPTVEVPSVDLSTYRVRARFSGDFASAARFIGGLQRIERALGIHSLEVKPARNGITVDLELDVYVDDSNQS